MAAKTSIQIRALELADFTFVRDLAAQQPTFSIPPSFILWVLGKGNPKLCLLAVDGEGQRLGYLLALSTTDPANSVYVWQLASSTPHATKALLQELYRTVSELSTDKVLFSAVPDSVEFRAIRQYVMEVSGSEVTALGRLPELVSPVEAEYYVRLDRQM